MRLGPVVAPPGQHRQWGSFCFLEFALLEQVCYFVPFHSADKLRSLSDQLHRKQQRVNNCIWSCPVARRPQQLSSAQCINLCSVAAVHRSWGFLHDHPGRLLRGVRRLRHPGLCLVVLPWTKIQKAAGRRTVFVEVQEEQLMHLGVGWTSKVVLVLLQRHIP